MEDRLAKTIANVTSWKELRQLETNISAKGGLTDEVATALKTRSMSLGVEYVVRETGLVMSELSEAEQRIVLAIGEYAGIMKLQGKTPNRTLQQIRSRGLIDAAEVSVCRKKPTQGFSVLLDADLEDLSYERIVLEYPDEFSPRAIWYSRRTLGLESESTKPPAVTHSDVQTRTAKLLAWLAERANGNDGFIIPFSNVEAASAIGLGALGTYGRVYGNIQSRIDFACYQCDLPPLGCTAFAPFKKAWGQDARSWSFPVPQLQQAAQGRQWCSADFEKVEMAAAKLPGIAHLPWRDELSKHEQMVKAWATRWAKIAGSSGTSGDQRHLHRLPSEVLCQATPEFIWAALLRFHDGSVSHPFGPSTDFDLLVDGHRFPPKAVFGVALSMALDGRYIEPKHFSAGEGSVCFRLLREAGFNIVPKGQNDDDPPPSDLSDEEWREGDRKLVSHWRKERATGLAKAKKAQYRRIHGKLTCEDCGVDPVEKYGKDLGESCIEVHHRKTAVSEMAPGHITSLDDLQCLCANCHRIAHRRMSAIQSG